jgi:hypothetical protein
MPPICGADLSAVQSIWWALLAALSGLSVMTWRAVGHWMLFDGSSTVYSRRLRHSLSESP